MAEQKYWPNCEMCRLENAENWRKDAFFCWHCGAKRPQPPTDWLVEVIDKNVIGYQVTPKMTLDDLKKNLVNHIRAHIREHGPKSTDCKMCWIAQERWEKFLGISERKDGSQ